MLAVDVICKASGQGENVWRPAPDMLVLTERDRHLDVMICLSISERVFTITSSVVTHNAFGRAYMVPVGQVHKLIVNSDLKRLKRTLERQQKAY